ncbi:hypothetical protein BJ741DRAFT_671269 [Chytriomyces cf. hyalinus JEL632]|nr:hypothetical protein BJ741DRAFT_671269 [Chytriomyces cf. hyalinus JEL632]
MQSSRQVAKTTTTTTTTKHITINGFTTTTITTRSEIRHSHMPSSSPSIVDSLAQTWHQTKALKGDTSSEAISAQIALAHAHESLGDYSHAEVLLASALFARFEENGFDNSDTLKSVEDLARVYNLQGFTKAAERMIVT